MKTLNSIRQQFAHFLFFSVILIGCGSIEPNASEIVELGAVDNDTGGQICTLQAKAAVQLEVLAPKGYAVDQIVVSLRRGDASETLTPFRESTKDGTEDGERFLYMGGWGAEGVYSLAVNVNGKSYTKEGITVARKGCHVETKVFRFRIQG